MAREELLCLRPENALEEAVSYKRDEKFAPRGSQRVFVGCFLLPDGVYKDHMLIVDLDELATASAGSKPRVYRIKKVRVPEIGTAFLFASLI